MPLTRKEVVKRAIKMQDPGRIPLFIFNGDVSDTDILQVVLEDWYMGENKDLTEWGFYWNKDNDDPAGMGVPRDIFIKDWADFEDYKKHHAPDPFRADRFKEADATDKGDKYFMGSLYLTGFTTMTFLRGFENLLIDLYEEPENVKRLAEFVFGIENDIIRQMPSHGFDAVSLFDDWGTQRSLMIAPDMWRDIFKPFYKEQFELCHSLGMDVFFHTCGYVYPIIGDLIECGVDMFNLAQADLNGMEKTSAEFRGKVCFAQPINYQTTGLFGSKEDIYAEVGDIIRCFGGREGGLIAELFDFEAMGWKPADPRNSEYTKQAFLDLG